MKKSYKTRTQMVHGGTRRSQYSEVGEALFLTQGFVYDSAEQAEQRFLQSGDDEFIYARYGNPTVAMFEDRIALLEGERQLLQPLLEWQLYMGRWHLLSKRAITSSPLVRFLALVSIF